MVARVQFSFPKSGTREMLYEPLRDAAVECGYKERAEYNSTGTEGISRIELTVGEGERSSTRAALPSTLLSTGQTWRS